MKRSKRSSDSPLYFPLWAWCLFFLALWQILLWAQPPSILMDDSGEMVAASWNLGLPHPPGYPLFNLLGHVFSWLPVGTAAFRFNLMSSLTILFSLAFILKTCVGFANKLSNTGNFEFLREALLVVAALAFMSCRSVFSECLSAKGCIYALTLLLISVLVWLRVLGFKIDRSIYIAWFLWGLGLANHWQTVVLLIPFMIFWTLWEAGFLFKNTIFAVFFSVLGLSLYLCLPLRSALAAQPSWGFPLHWIEFKWVVLRQLVADEEMKIHSFAFYWHGLTSVIQSGRFWMPGVAVSAAAGLFALYRFEKTLVLVFSMFVLPILLAVVVVHEANNLYLIPIYLMPLSGLVLFLSFGGLFWLLSKGSRFFQITLLLVLFLFSIFWGWSVFENQNRSRYTLAEDFGENVLKGLPRGTVFLADGDNYLMPIWYEKYVNRQRPDLVVAPMVFLYHDWGWNQLAIQSDDLKKAAKFSNTLNGRLTWLIEKSRHPFFYSFGRQFWPEDFNHLKGSWLPQGLAYGWGPSLFGEKNAAESFQRMFFQERFRGLEINREAALEDPPTSDLYSCYAQQHVIAADWFHRQKKDMEALAQLESALFFQPESPLIYTNMASLVGSMGYLKMSHSLSQIAIGMDSQIGLNYANLAKVDSEQGKYFEAKQEFEKALNLGVNRQWIETQVALLDRETDGKTRIMIEDKSSLEYEKWSEILEKSGCPFLSRIAFQWSGQRIK